MINKQGIVFLAKTDFTWIRINCVLPTNWFKIVEFTANLQQILVRFVKDCFSCQSLTHASEYLTWTANLARNMQIDAFFVRNGKRAFNSLLKNYFILNYLCFLYFSSNHSFYCLINLTGLPSQWRVVLV